MAITIPSAESIGAFDTHVATDEAERGNYAPRLAVALKTLATETTADIAVVTAAAAAAQATADEAGGGATTGSASSTTATNTAVAMPGHDMLQNLLASGDTLTTISTGVTSQALGGVYSCGLIVPEVVFPAGAWTGDVVLAGLNSFGAAQSVTLTNPGAGGGTVKSPKAFATFTLFTNTAPSGAGSIVIKVSTRFAVKYAPVVAFLGVTQTGENYTGSIVETDLTNGWIDFGAFDSANVYSVRYTYSLNLVQASHTHTITLA
jgi:hypothetical protein